MSERLLFLRAGAVDIVRDDVILARVAEPGAVLGDMAVILGRPHWPTRGRQRGFLVETLDSLGRAMPGGVPM